MLKRHWWSPDACNPISSDSNMGHTEQISSLFCLVVCVFFHTPLKWLNMLNKTPDSQSHYRSTLILSVCLITLLMFIYVLLTPSTFSCWNNCSRPQSSLKVQPSSTSSFLKKNYFIFIFYLKVPCNSRGILASACAGLSSSSISFLQKPEASRWLAFFCWRSLKFHAQVKSRPCACDCGRSMNLPNPQEIHDFYLFIYFQ